MQKCLLHIPDILSFSQIIQELPRIKNQCLCRYRSHNNGFAEYFLVFFDDGNRHFRELVGAHVAVVEEQGLFGVKEVKHVFKGLVVSDAVAAELKMT